MPLQIKTFPLGPLANNTYLIFDDQTRAAAIIDPTFDSHRIAAWILQNNLTLEHIWLTHAHFDHIAGARLFAALREPPVPVGLHPADLELYRTGGGAANFGIEMPPSPEPADFFQDGQVLQLGAETIEVRHTPGHTPGHVIFYIPSAESALTGDLIFQQGVGRTDLPGGSTTSLLKSIYEQVFTLPEHTRLLSGHGPETTVQAERESNPYLS